MTEGVLEFKTIDPPERSRTYIFADGRLTVDGVTRICVRPSGSHRLETANGRKFCVAAGWLGIEIDVDAWSL